METLTHSVNYELPQELHYDKYAQHIKTHNLADTTTIALAAAPNIATFDTATHQTTTSEFLQKLGATFIHSIQLQSLNKIHSLETSQPSVTSISNSNMDIDFGPGQLIMETSNFNELQKQLEYDKFMNEVWIGVVLTLILISMVFCFCSCFLYHQFRMWKRNYRTTIIQSSDVEAVKLNMDLDDPVPEYTLVSGLPTYEAALELLDKNPHSCVIVHPSVFEVFNRNEKSATENTIETETTTSVEAAAVPLLNDSSLNAHDKSILPSYTEATTPTTPTTPTNVSLTYNHSLANILSLTSHKSQLKNKSTATTSNDMEKQLKS